MIPSLNHGGRRSYVCDKNALLLECEADNVFQMIWRSSDYIGNRAQIHFGSSDIVGVSKHRRDARASLTRNTASGQGDRRNLTSQLIITPESSFLNGSVECSTAEDGAPAATVQILVSGQYHGIAV